MRFFMNISENKKTLNCKVAASVSRFVMGI